MNVGVSVMREVVQPTVPKDDRDQVIRRAAERVRSTVTAYPTGDVTA